LFWADSPQAASTRRNGTIANLPRDPRATPGPPSYRP